MNELIIIAVILIGSIGALLYFIGWVNTIIFALSKKQHGLAIILFLVSPLSIIYCIKHWHHAAKHGKQMMLGLILICVTAIPAYLYVNSLAV
jgi:formate hydrogenlyase subunit 3/multisubunit Na+/H+ antiporter MnhD subunit